MAWMSAEDGAEDEQAAEAKAPPKISRIGAIDPVIALRKKMRQERMEQLAVYAKEARFGSSATSRPQSAMSGRQRRGEVPAPVSQETSRSGDQPVPNGAVGANVCASSSAGPQKLPVERFHRNLVRREVWRQKFDYLYRQMQKECESDKVKAATGIRRSSVASEGTVEDEAEPGTEGTGKDELDTTCPRLSASAVGEHEEENRNATPQSFSRHTSAGGNSSATVSRFHKASSGVAEFIEEPLQSYDNGVEKAKPPSKLVCAGWILSPDASEPELSMKAPASWGYRPARQRKALPSRGAGHTSSIAGSRSRQNSLTSLRGADGSGGLLGRYPATPMACNVARKESTHRLLKSSHSVPVVPVPQELSEVQDGYYQGDELLMHEDILHATNPHLFPLRPVRDKVFPLQKLAAVR
eukprot:TRINITY_DN55232_c0_g1_i1.p1 TRINITY_DN55232_c0_g1~~TRINITY_DN55232_c0_g1_i1.p1  ORF type:complete len:429 (+),score=91.05 TRINITY_DN55232_c0_g1_i1:55-1287(+)